MRPGRLPRPTLRCVREDLGYKKLPPASQPLDKLDDAVLAKSGEVARAAPQGVERVVELIVARTPDVTDIHALVLDSMPAIADRKGWFMEPMPDRDPAPSEIGWSNMLDEPALVDLLAARDA